MVRNGRSRVPFSPRGGVVVDMELRAEIRELQVEDPSALSPQEPLSPAAPRLPCRNPVRRNREADRTGTDPSSRYESSPPTRRRRKSSGRRRQPPGLRRGPTPPRPARDRSASSIAPRALTSAMSIPEPSKRSRLPSADQRGPVCQPSEEVSCTGDPSRKRRRPTAGNPPLLSSRRRSSGRRETSWGCSSSVAGM